jgi:hypothetical protein
MILMTELDEKSAQIREVYAHFGLAMYLVQCVERSIAIVLTTEYGPGVRKITRAQYDELLQSLFKQTLGTLIVRLRHVTTLPNDFEARLRDVLETRNWLTHHYFCERAGKFMTQRGREAMLRELAEIQRRLEEVDAYFDGIAEAWGERHGITKETIAQYKKHLVQEV